MSGRQVKKTRFVYCEGSSDKAFLDCLRLIYTSSNHAIDIKRGEGGDQIHIVKKAILKGAAYDEKYVKIDGDRHTAEMAQAEELASTNGVVVLRTTPCIERLLINILEPTKQIGSWGTKKLKKYFRAAYIPQRKATDIRAYQKIFTKDILDEARIRLPELKELIALF